MELKSEKASPREKDFVKGKEVILGDPDSYNHLTEEEKEAETRRLMANHRVFAKDAFNEGKKRG